MIPRILGLGALILGFLTAPLASRAQPATPLIGFLAGRSAADGPTHPIVRAFHEGLRELGGTIGENIRIEYRWSGDRHGRLESLAD